LDAKRSPTLTLRSTSDTEPAVRGEAGVVISVATTCICILQKSKSSSLRCRSRPEKARVKLHVLVASGRKYRHIVSPEQMPSITHSTCIKSGNLRNSTTVRHRTPFLNPLLDPHHRHDARYLRSRCRGRQVHPGLRRLPEASGKAANPRSVSTHTPPFRKGQEKTSLQTYTMAKKDLNPVRNGGLDVGTQMLT